MSPARTLLETEKLILRHLTTRDTAFIISLLNSEGWIKYIGDRNIKTAEQAKQYLLNGPLKSYADNGFGLYLVALKNGNIPVGMCGLVKRAYLPHPDIGYAFLPEATGKGYALEAARAVLTFAFTSLKMDKILAITVPENEKSVSLLHKLGMLPEEKFKDPLSGEMLERYSICRKTD